MYTYIATQTHNTVTHSILIKGGTCTYASSLWEHVISRLFLKTCSGLTLAYFQVNAVLDVFLKLLGTTSQVEDKPLKMEDENGRKTS